MNDVKYVIQYDGEPFYCKDGTFKYDIKKAKKYKKKAEMQGR